MTWSRMVKRVEKWSRHHVTTEKEQRKSSSTHEVIQKYFHREKSFHLRQSKTSMKTILFEILLQALLQQWTLSRKNHLARRHHSHTKYRHIPGYQHQHYNDHHRNHHDGQHDNEISWCNLLQVKTAFLGLGSILQLSKNLAVFFIVMVKSFWGADCDLG